MIYEEAIAYMEQYQCLPLCEHGNHVIDWGSELLAPPCGCSLTKRAADGARFCPACHALLEEHSVYCDTCGL